ncbi:MAG: hypothetical protein HRT42_11790 [Campylobacteraceae bacterium]|nr:hypothetical protein [Campylobacteraceae bacterium]
MTYNESIYTKKILSFTVATSTYNIFDTKLEKLIATAPLIKVNNKFMQNIRNNYFYLLKGSSHRPVFMGLRIGSSPYIVKELFNIKGLSYE